MGMNDLKQWYYRRNPDYSDINESAWFKDITLEACEHSERRGNRIYVYFPTAECHAAAVEKCKARNISCIGCIYDTLTETYRLDIMMNWKERRPSRSVNTLPQKLD